MTVVEKLKILTVFCCGIEVLDDRVRLIGSSCFHLGCGMLVLTSHQRGGSWVIESLMTLEMV